MKPVPILIALAFSLDVAAAPPQDFDRRVESLRQQIGVPGMAVAIVEDGKVTLAKGFGVKKLGSPEPGSLDEFRAGVRASTRSPERMLIASYCRSALGQTGAGHYSPIGGYHAGSDRLLLLDVARFKYPPHWVPVSLMFEAMRDRDPATGRPRGWLMLAKRATSSAVRTASTQSHALKLPGARKVARRAMGGSNSFSRSCCMATSVAASVRQMGATRWASGLKYTRSSACAPPGCPSMHASRT